MNKTILHQAFALVIVLAAMLLPTAGRAQAYDKEETYNGGAFYELIAYDTYLDELANVLKAVELNRGSASITGGSITNDDFGPSPLGSGLGILLAAGAGYAALRRKRSRKNTTLLLACVLLLGFTQCKKEQPQGSDTEVKTVGITLKVGGNSGSKHTINTTTGAVGFEEHDLIYVGNGGKYIGTLECNNSGVFTGDINEPVDNTEMYFYFIGGLTPSTLPVAGTTPSFTVDISDQSSKMPVLSCNHVTYHTGTSSYSCVLQNQCALVKFTNLSTSAPIHVGGLYTEALIDFENNCITNNGTTGFINLKSESKTAKWAVLLPQTSFVNVEGVVAEYGYNITMPAAIEADAFLTGENAVRFGSTSSHNKYLQWAITGTTLENGDHVYGTLAGNYKVSVAAGATVTLHNVNINGSGTWTSGNYAGINCLGNATINLAEGTTNAIKGFNQNYPGIHIPSGSTLTIQGTGTLNASSNGYGAGIGGGDYISCGNIIINSGTVTATGGSNGVGIGVGTSASCGSITITGGTVTATGGSSCAGIGSGYYYSSCSTITISGGTVTANGGTAAAGIGSGYHSSSCGAITIENTVTRVTATKGVGANSIGAGYESSCGTVTIGGVVGAISISPYTYIPGALSGTFSVSSTKQVYFSQGNLQYQASTSTWRFAEHQWDYVGDATNGNVYVGAVKSNNALIASDYSGWIDMFGWGTSGYNHGANCYQPYSTSTNNQDYYAYGSYTYNLYDQTGRADWGYTVSAANLGGHSDWYTLKVNEWGYVFNTRSTTSGVRYAKAKVNGVAGVILLPDDWSTSYHSLTSTNTDDANYTANNISSSDWTNDFEAHGAVFLPAVGRRYGTDLYNAGVKGNYWSSSNGGSQNTANRVYFTSSSLNPQENNGRHDGYAVRLVRNAN